LAAAPEQTARLLRRRDAEPDWSAAPGGDTDGTRRALFPRLHGTNFRAGMNLLPAGQWSPPHTYNAEHIIVLLEGQVDWTVDDTVYELRDAHDMLFIAAGAEYTPTNPGPGDALFLSILGRVDEWPGRAVYRDGTTYVG
jgi:quercetin dioxygenase-like cupin family protein